MIDTGKAKRHANASSLSCSSGIGKTRQKQHAGVKARQQRVSRPKAAQTLIQEAEADTASSSCVPEGVKPQACAQHGSCTRHIAPQAVQLQLPKTGLTMAMTCCDMNDQTQGTDFLPLSPSFDTSDFFFFSTVANNCKVSSAQRKNVQHHLSQTVSPNRSASVTTSVQQSFKVAHRNSSDTWLSSLPCNTSATPLKVAFKPASANNTSPLSPVNYEAALPQQLHPPAPPHRKLAQILFRSPGVGVGCSHHVITAPSTDASFAAKPNLTSKPTSLLQRLVRRHLAHHSAAQQVSMTAESCSSASEADLYFSTMRPDPINSSSALLHKLLQTQHGWKEWFGEQPDVG